MCSSSSAILSARDRTVIAELNFPAPLLGKPAHELRNELGSIVRGEFLGETSSLPNVDSDPVSDDSNLRGSRGRWWSW